MRQDDRPYWNPDLETLAWAEVERWQAGQITRALPAIRARSAFYGEHFAGVVGDPGIASLADLARLPFTVKDDVRAAQEAASDELPFGRNQAAPLVDIVQTLCSSGTTGRPIYYALTRHDADVFADAIANNWYTAGLRADDVVAHLVGLPMVAGGLPYADGFRRLGATLAWLGGFPTERVLAEMRRLRCTALLSTTSFGLYLGEHWAAVGRETGVASRLAKVLCGGESGAQQAEIRQRICDGLGTTHLRDTMGLGDVISGMWAECEAQDGMHFNAQRHVAVELIDPASGEVRGWREGESGELVYTTFDREATPLVRYRSRDHALVVGMACACGRTSPRIRVIGRTDDMLIYKGMNVFPAALRDLIVEGFGGRVEPQVRVWKERRDQVRFDDPIAIDVEASPAGASEDPANLAAAIEAEIRRRLQVRVRVTVLAPGSLPRSVYKNALTAVRDGA